jgi:hypothetical protein
VKVQKYRGGEVTARRVDLPDGWTGRTFVCVRCRTELPDRSGAPDDAPCYLDDADPQGLRCLKCAVFPGRGLL